MYWNLIFSIFLLVLEHDKLQQTFPDFCPGVLFGVDFSKMEHSHSAVVPADVLHKLEDVVVCHGGIQHVVSQLGEDIPHLQVIKHRGHNSLSNS